MNTLQNTTNHDTFNRTCGSRVVIVNKAKLGSREADDFDVEFWRGIPRERKLEIAWDMVAESTLMKGHPDATEQRLQRHVLHFERRRR